MKSAVVPHLPVLLSESLACLGSRLLEDGAEISLDVFNWTETQPVRTRVFLGWTEGHLLLHFVTEEPTVRAVCGVANGPVFQDSCVEFFSAPEGAPGYYNFEFNAIGEALLSHRLSFDQPDWLSEELRTGIRRESSLGSVPFEERPFTGEWSLTAVVPVASFFHHRVPFDLSGFRLPANFYKCGNLLTRKHFLSWSKVDVPTPQFHHPRFFGELRFASR